MKTIGILGGFGPSTTAEFFLSLISSWNKTNNIVRPEILIWNAPVNKQKEKMFITKDTCSQHFLPLLKSGIVTLEKSGVDFLVLPCNSLHIFIDQIRQSTNLPVISILEETTKRLVSTKVSKIVLLGNETTINSHLFDKNFREADIQILLPTESDLQLLNPTLPGVKFIDTLEILEQAAIEKMVE